VSQKNWSDKARGVGSHGVPCMQLQRTSTASTARCIDCNRNTVTKSETRPRIQTHKRIAAHATDRREMITSVNRSLSIAAAKIRGRHAHSLDALGSDTLKLQLLLGSTHLSHLRNGSAECRIRASTQSQCKVYQSSTSLTPDGLNAKNKKRRAEGAKESTTPWPNAVVAATPSPGPATRRAFPFLAKRALAHAIASRCARLPWMFQPKANISKITSVSSSR
jgi:hypothetical protein